MSEGVLASVPGDEEEPLEEAVDLDLDALDSDLRDEAIGKPTSVRIDGKTVHIMHAGDWPQSAMRAASMGDWEGWARQVILDDPEFLVWQDADLRNYQIEAVFEQCGKRARMNMGKSRRRSGSSRGSRKH